jgi:hypothetical protein
MPHRDNEPHPGSRPRHRVLCLMAAVIFASVTACDRHPVGPAAHASATAIAAVTPFPAGAQATQLASAIRAHLGPARGIIAAALGATATDGRALRVCRAYQVTMKVPITAALDSTLGQVKQAVNPGVVRPDLFTLEGPLTKYAAICALSLTAPQVRLFGGFHVAVLAVLNDGSGSGFFVYLK